MGGRLIAGDGERLFRGAALDSRRVVGGELFFALAGEKTDGHRFVGDALERGAAAAVVSRDVEAPAGSTLVRVDDTFAALHELTRAVRREVPQHLVAITGSVGKTTTKELLATILERRFKVARSPGNLNNLYGFPIALLGIPDDTEWMVAEMGMSTPGELAGVSRLGRPDVAVFTNVRPAHLEAFEDGEVSSDLERMAHAKSELLEGLAEDGTVVANAADPWVVRIAEEARRRGAAVVWYALAQDLPQDWREPLLATAEEIETEPGCSHFALVTEGGDRQPVDLPLHGRANVENFLAAATCALLLGLPPAEIAEAAGAVEALGGRGVLLELPAGGWLVDDSYNSNPDALAQALAAARELPGRRHWAVLGSMLELGSASEKYHHEAGVQAALLGFNPIVAVGDEARALADGAAKQGVETIWLPGSEEAARFAATLVRSGDVILVKGSRGIGLERVVSELRQGEAG